MTNENFSVLRKMFPATAARVVLLWLFFLLSVTAMAQTETSPLLKLDSGLIGCYTFAGSAKDHSGMNNDGIRHEIDLTTDRFNRTNNAYLFTGNNSITLPAGPVISSRTLTFSAWVYTNVNPSFEEAQFVFSIGNDHGYFGEILSRNYTRDNLSGWGATGSANGELAPGSDVNFVLPQLRTWYHLAFVISEDSTRYFINGIPSRGLRTGNSIPYHYQCSTCVVTIGALPDRSLGYKGIIDDVSLHSRALSKAEVKALYLHGLPCVEALAEVEDISSCGPTSCTLMASGGKIFRWYDAPSNGNLLFEGNPFVTGVLTETTAYYTSVVLNNVESKRSKVTVSIFPEPVLDCNFEKAVRHQDGLRLEPVATGGTEPYTWLFAAGDGFSEQTPAPHFEHTFNVPGVFPVAVTLTDANGCKQQCENEVAMEYTLFVPNIVIANDDTLNRVLTMFFKKDGVNVPYDGSRSFSMTVFDRWGQQVFNTTSPANGWTGNNNPTGIYYYSLRLGEEKRKGWISLVR